MLNRSFLITVALLAAAVIASAQAADPAVSDVDRLKESLANWKQIRDQSGGDYSYRVERIFFSGLRETTTIVVRGNKVVERRFQVSGRPQPSKPGENPPAEKPTWVETGKDLGRHKDEGAATRSVDELYVEAFRLLDMKVPEHHKRYLGIDQQGLLSHCFIVDTRIADDAPIIGIAPVRIQPKAKK
jgi:hypothetical protein